MLSRARHGHHNKNEEGYRLVFYLETPLAPTLREWVGIRQ